MLCRGLSPAPKIAKYINGIIITHNAIPVAYNGIIHFLNSLEFASARFAQRIIPKLRIGYEVSQSTPSFGIAVGISQ
jgi:hypothetical protein